MTDHPTPKLIRLTVGCLLLVPGVSGVLATELDRQDALSIAALVGALVFFGGLVWRVRSVTELRRRSLQSNSDRPLGSGEA